MSAQASKRRTSSGLTLVVSIGVVAVLAALCTGLVTKRESRVTGSTGAAPHLFVAELPERGGTVCQAVVASMVGADSIELLAGSYGSAGPALRLTLVGAQSRTFARGELRAGWAEGPIRIRLAAPIRGQGASTVCITSAGGSRVTFAGEAGGVDPALIDAKPASGRLSAVFRTSKPESLLDLLPTLGERLGRGNASWIGKWTLYFIGALLLLGLGLGGMAVVWIGHDPTNDGRSGRRLASWRFIGAAVARVPKSGRALVLAAAAIGTAWAFLTPPFQVPDETSHIAYVQYLGETGRLPIERPGSSPFSPEENALLGALGFARVVGRSSSERVIWTPESEANLRRTEEKGASERGQGNATTASANPPLYYLLQTPVYLATSRGSLLTQILAMRLLSVLLLSGTVLCAYLFVRELLPNSPIAWTAGGLACAFQPVLGFIGSGVNADSLLFLTSTGAFLAIARILQRGLTTSRGVFLGIVLAAGLLTKPLFLALVPAAGLAVILGGWRLKNRAAKPVIATGVLAFTPVFLVAIIGATVFDHPYFAVTSSVTSGLPASDIATSSSAMRELSYIFQLFLPRLPFLDDQIPGVPVKDLWVSGFVGRFGWVDYGFGPGANRVGTWVVTVLLMLLVVAVVKFNRSVRASWRLLVCSLLALVLVPTAVGVVDYRAFVTNSPRFEQARYLLPLLGLYAGLFAIAVKVLGTKLGLIATAGLWVLVSFHTVAAMVLTANRYYL